MTKNQLRPGLPPLPERIAKLPVDAKGYPVPWFVRWIDGKPDHRIADATKFLPALRDRICWVCGQKLSAYGHFVLGPMCTVNRVTSEPPTHRDCAEFSVRACPFLSRPHASRRDHDYPEGNRPPPGVYIARNPGVMAVWMTNSWTPKLVGINQWLIDIGEPASVEWWTQGRIATRKEVEDAVVAGTPDLTKLLDRHSAEEIREFEANLARARDHYPEWPMAKTKPKKKRIKARIIARAGTISKRDEMRVWLTVRSSIVVYERQWPGNWPPQVGDEITIDAGETDDNRSE